jgi:CheY-like chemotaxis protein
MTRGRHFPSGRFQSLNILVVEDETLVSFLVEDLLRELGCADVWHAGRVDDALDLLSSRKPDAAILDVNLGGELVYPVAERLQADAVPLVFATGYGRGGVPEPWNERPVLRKPFGVDELASALDTALAG